MASQPAIDGKHFIVPKNINDQSFILKCYEKNNEVTFSL